jgi:hypothetical protein
MINGVMKLFNRDENEVVGITCTRKRTVENITYHFPEFPPAMIICL